MLDFLVMGLAVWRLSAMFSYECGPFDVFVKIREAVGIKHDYPDTNCPPSFIPDNLLSQLLGCVWCLSVWFAIIIMVSYSLWPGDTIFVCKVFTLSAVAIIAERAVRG